MEGLSPEDRDAMYQFADSNPVPEEAWTGMHDLANMIDDLLPTLKKLTGDTVTEYEYVEAHNQSDVQDKIEEMEKKGYSLADQYAEHDQGYLLGFHLFFKSTKRSSNV